MSSYTLRKLFDLKVTIAVFVVVLFVSTIWALAHNLDGRVKGNFKQVLSAQQLQTAEHVAKSIDVALKLRVNALTEIATLLRSDDLANPARLRSLLEASAANESLFSEGFLVIAPNGRLLADLPSTRGLENIDYREADFFADVIESGKPEVGKPIIHPTTKKATLPVAVPIKNAKSEVIGVLVGRNRIAGNNFLNEVLPSKLQFDGDVHVISDKSGLYIVSTDPSKIMQRIAPVGVETTFDRYRQGFEGSGISVDSQGVENLNSAKRITSTGWLVVVSLPTEQAFRSLESLQNEIYKEARLAAVIIALLFWLFLHSQISPLGRSASTIDAMTAGREPLRALPLEGGKEVRLLIDSFNKLQDHIKEQQAALQAREEQIQVAASVFGGTSEAILISSSDNLIVSVNRAFCKMTGYVEAELVGQNPRLLQSGRHGLSYYKEMWADLQNVGQWHGEIWNRRKNGEIYPARITISVLFDDAGKVLRYIAIAADITSRKKSEDEINSLAFYDPLTELPNRRLLLDRLRQAMATSARSQKHGALLFIDLDNFKTLNDTLGHDIGDMLLRQVGQRLLSCVREGDTVGRLGGDEFVVMLEELSKDPMEASGQAEVVGNKVIASLNQAYQLDSFQHHSTPSIGVVIFVGHHETVDELMKRADLAMYQAKAAGRNNIRFYDPQMQVAIMTRVALESDLRDAVAQDQFVLHYQPQVSRSGKVGGVEALVRWHHPKRGMVQPGEFIALTEETGLILKLGRWVLETACHQLTAWAKQPDFQHLTIAVNVSARQFHHREFVKQVTAILELTGANPERLKLELTESLLAHDIEDINAKMTSLKAKGVSFSLDDFGTGYSSLSYLKQLPLDQLKIDQSFVRDILTDPNDAAIAKMVISLAESMGLEVIAEGVETEAQREFLAGQGCHAYQGYLIGRPLPIIEFETYARQG
jgi:diguanylate cyclase (GGDEF)-like protein/PAS domain S-box-containing protein